MKVFHNEDGNPARANIKQALGRISIKRRWRWKFPVPEISIEYRMPQHDLHLFMNFYERPHKGVKDSANS
ncbi:hypothetical protein Tco_0745720 [Tanacetum coccineum]